MNLALSRIESLKVLRHSYIMAAGLFLWAEVKIATIETHESTKIKGILNPIHFFNVFPLNLISFQSHNQDS